MHQHLLHRLLHQGGLICHSPGSELLSTQVPANYFHGACRCFEGKLHHKFGLQQRDRCKAHTLLQHRKVALTTTIIAASNCCPIAAKKNCVGATSGYLRVCHTFLQHRNIALTIFSGAASNCCPIAAKKNCVAVTS